ncbi:MAG TPA: ATP-binding protein [Salinivirga sp.]|uniref:sensor histidine kinase n=1 Tax=Salinivirga sp. TaxID=1970192 RepID=UPI002B46A8D8|nr:ATP-binding protein [Salinivirga sp.]HKK58284.1 ATP-binding protein [Salinivirga sp.]
MRIIPRKYFYNPLLIAAAAIIIFTPVYFLTVKKFNLELVKAQSTNKKIYYFDIDSDGVSEKIEYYGYVLSDEFKRATVILKSQNNSIQGIWNHNGRFLLYSEPIITDYNNDSLKEIFTFHRRKDSIFLNGINPLKKDRFFIQDRFLDKSRFVNGTVDLKIYGVGSKDINGDNYKEIIFSINAGFSLQPRNLYIYDIKNDSLRKSPESYSHLTGNHAINIDINNDGFEEYILQTHASSNLTDHDVAYPDNSSYLMVLDDSLDLLFEPYVFHSPLSILYSYPILIKDSIHFLSYFRSSQNRSNDSLFIFNAKGEKITGRSLEEKGALVKFPTCFTGQSRHPVLKKTSILLDNGQLLTFDNNLKITERRNILYDPVNVISPIKISINNKPGYGIVSENKVSITDEKFNLLGQVALDNTKGLKKIFLMQRGKTKRPQYFIQGSEKQYIIDLFINPWYKNWWLVLLLAWVTLSFTVYLIKTINTLIREYNMSKLLTERENHKTQLARELHDELGSRITGLRLKIASLQQDKYQNDLDELSVDLQKTHEEVRSIIYNLAPPHITQNNFSNLIKQLAGNYKTLNSFQITVEFLPDTNIFDNIDDFKQKELYRVVQEALNNAAKHSGATEIIVQFIKRGSVLELFIDDNGVGFETEKSLNRMKGQGIKSMETRIKMLKGHFYIYSAERKGTSIAIQIPLKTQKNGRKKLLNFVSRRP